MKNEQRINLYIRKEDIEIWKWAREYARNKRYPITAFLTNILEEVREKQDSK